LVGKWVSAVKTLSVVAEHYPQTAYAGFTFCLQNEWQYVQRVVADTGPFFQPLEREIWQASFPPSLVFHQRKSTGDTASSLPTVSSWEDWQSAIRWTPPAVAIAFKRMQSVGGYRE
jgi:hypothetical protein